MLFFAVFILTLFGNCGSGVEFNANRVIAVNLETKIKYYYPIIDSTQKDTFTINYQNITEQIAKIKGDIKVIGERIMVSKDSMLIEVFVMSKRKNDLYITFIKNTNGVACLKEYNRKLILPELSLLCNAHYFYLPKSKLSKTKYNIYSILAVDKQTIEAKIFLSDKFDDFNNVVSPCDDTELVRMIAYLNKSFEDLSKE